MNFKLHGAPQLIDSAGTAVGHTVITEEQWLELLGDDPVAGLQRLRGPFAVQVALSNQKTLIAVDRFAIHGMCWRLENGKPRCAERADDLAVGDASIDPQAIFDYLYFHSIPSPQTIFKGVYRLPPGHMALFENGRVTIEPYWKPSFESRLGQADFIGLKQEFLSLLQQVTADSLDGSKPACYLSGGTDSSSVAGMIRAATGQAPNAYSIGFKAEGYDEMEFARIAAKRFGAVHHEYYVTPDDVIAGIPLVAAHYDQPFGNSSAVPAYFCARMAREDGVTRILAGDGGDELFGGNARYADQRAFGWYKQVPGPMRSVLEPIFGLPLAARTPLLKKGAGYIRQAKMPLPDRLQRYNLLEKLGAHNVFTADFLAQVNVSGPMQQQRAVWQMCDADNDLDRNLAFDWRYTLAENDLPKVRGSAQMAQVNVGFPMLDQRFVNFSTRLPPHYKLKGLHLRWFFKEALRGILPDEIITKSKHGFGLPFGLWAISHDGLHALATDSLKGLATRGFIQPAFVTSLLGVRAKEHAAYYGEMVWILMLLEQWLRIHAPEYRLGG